MSKFTKGPWKFQRMDSYEQMAALQGKPLAEHEGFFRTNGGDWSVGTDEGPVAQAIFKGKAKRGQAWCAPDPEGQANARLIAAAPDMAEMLKSELETQCCVCRLNPLVGAPVPCQTCMKRELLTKAGVL